MSEWNHDYSTHRNDPHYQGFYLLKKHHNPNLYIVKIHPGKFELWKLTEDNSGDRLENHSFKCLNEHKTLKAAKLAYKLSIAAGLDKL